MHNTCKYDNVLKLKVIQKTINDEILKWNIINTRTKVNCKQTKYYSAKYEKGIIWNDKSLKLNWKFKKPILSNKDKKQPKFYSWSISNLNTGHDKNLVFFVNQ